MRAPTDPRAGVVCSTTSREYKMFCPRQGMGGGGGCRSYAHVQDDTAAMSAYQLFAVI
jgi:hypothetical protein